MVDRTSWPAVRLLIGFTLLLTVTGSAQADTLPFASLEFPPYNYQENGNVTGFTTEIVKRITREMGHTPAVKLLPWKRAQTAAGRGKYAGIFTFTKSIERMRNFHYTAPVVMIKDVFFKRRTDSISWNTLSDLSEYKIGASAYNYADVFLNAMENDTFDVQVIHAETPEILHLRKLKHNRIDLAICELRLCQFLIQQRPETLRDIDHIKRPIGPVRTFHIGISREWPQSRELVRKFNRHLKAMASDGTLQSLRRKHLTPTRINQPLEDFAEELVNDLRIHFAFHDVAPRNGSVTERLKRTVTGHLDTLGWKHGTTVIAWVRKGNVWLTKKGSAVTSSSDGSGPDKDGGIVQTSGDFSLGLVRRSNLSNPKDLTVQLESTGDQSTSGGYLILNASRVMRVKTIDSVKAGRTLQPFTDAD